ncbi:hypothetical protein WOLCODRAFT_157827 [Wolfiporia cocos MD-104 SS10]|uniref:Uncharacterized protein n=1 Tax=Wolfiporia cocos (strain MD-104) TaxID=742152 RepID=A0A2H3JBD2_WOLCO|nr:hypothetical protein WOLCODRAFT_157827 [Wolfiporia cocos MD-104 SS10]
MVNAGVEPTVLILSSIDRHCSGHFPTLTPPLAILLTSPSRCWPSAPSLSPTWSCAPSLSYTDPAPGHPSHVPAATRSRRPPAADDHRTPPPAMAAAASTPTAPRAVRQLSLSPRFNEPHKGAQVCPICAADETLAPALRKKVYGSYWYLGRHTERWHTGEKSIRDHPDAYRTEAIPHVYGENSLMTNRVARMCEKRIFALLSS